MIRLPSWIKKLPPKERLRAKAIYVFLWQHRRRRKLTDVEAQRFEKLVEASGWPQDGAFPSVSSKTAETLGIDLPEWDDWRNFSKLRVLVRGIKKKLLFAAQALS